MQTIYPKTWSTSCPKIAKIFFRLTSVAQKCRCFNSLITNLWSKKKRKSCTFFLPYLTWVFAIFLFPDAHDNVFMEVPNSKCTTANGCDSNAFCACGTVSGIYQCVCKQGYYGAGTPGHCYRKLSHSGPEKLRIYGQNLVWGVGGRRFACAIQSKTVRNANLSQESF